VSKESEEEIENTDKWAHLNVQTSDSPPEAPPSNETAALSNANPKDYDNLFHAAVQQSQEMSFDDL